MPTKLPDEQVPSAEVVPDASSWLEFDPEIGGILNAATHQGWGTDQLTQALRSSSAFQEVTQRRQRLADPAQADDARAQLGIEVSRMLGRSGDDPTVQDAVQRLAAGQATMAGISSVMAPMAGEATTPERVIELAASHGVPMSPANAAQWTSMDEGALERQFADMSQGLYPWKPPQIPYQQFASVFADTYHQQMGTPIDPEDPSFQAMLEQSQGNLGAFRQMVRQSDAWQQSPQGQAALAQRSNQLVADILNGGSTQEEIARNRQTFEQQQAVAFGQAMQPLSPPARPAPSQGGGGGGGGGGGIVDAGGGRFSVGQAHGLSAAEAWIISHESGGNPEADNPHSTAYGFGQLLWDNRVSYGGRLGFSPTTTDPDQQLAMFRLYVKERYRTAENAKAFWQAHGWY